MKFGFIAKHRGIWPADWLCGALGVSRGGFMQLRRPSWCPPSRRQVAQGEIVDERFDFAIEVSPNMSEFVE